jgi:hypothetical protein
MAFANKEHAVEGTLSKDPLWARGLGAIYGIALRRIFKDEAGNARDYNQVESLDTNPSDIVTIDVSKPTESFRQRMNRIGETVIDSLIDNSIVRAKRNADDYRFRQPESPPDSSDE